MFLEWSRMKDALRSGEILFTPEIMLELFEDKMRPIELPTDDEIESKSVIEYQGYTLQEQQKNLPYILAFEKGAQWIKQQIKGKLK